MSNLADLLKPMFGDNNKALNISGNILGTAADLSGALGFADIVLSWFESNDVSLSDVLNQVTADFNQLSGQIAASDKLQRMRDIDAGIDPALKVLLELPATLASSPPASQDYKNDQIATCAGAVAFFAENADKWQVVQADWPYYSDEWSGLLAPPTESDGLAFNYVYTLPQFLRSINILLTTIYALEPTTVALQSPVISAAISRLQTIHQTIVASGIAGTKMPGIQDAGHITVNKAASPYTATFSGPNWQNSDVGIWPLGAVDIYSGDNNVSSYWYQFEYDNIDLTTFSGNQAANFLKLVQLRIEGAKKSLYTGVGFSVWQAINQLLQLIGQPVLTDPLYSSWPSAELLSILGVTLPPPPADLPPVPWWQEPYGMEVQLASFLLETPPYVEFRRYGGSDPTVPNYDRATGTIPVPAIALPSGNLFTFLTGSPWAAQHPYVFMFDTAGQLWLNWLAAPSWQWVEGFASWYWVNQGFPQAGVHVASGIGALTVMDSLGSSQRPYIHVIGSDGNFWINWWNYTGWAWSNQASPAMGVTVAAPVGTLTVMDTPTSAQRPYTFVTGSDGNLWINWWTDTQWIWSNQGLPEGITLGASVGVITVMDSPASAQRPYVYVIGSDGNLWSNWWNYTNWVWWNQGSPQPGVNVVSPVGAVSVMDSPTSAQRPYAFVIGSDGHLWANWWDDTAWHWDDLGTPQAGLTILLGVGAGVFSGSPSAAQSPFSFVVTSDGQLWWNYWDGASGWQWESQGTPQTAVTVTAGVGAITVMTSPDAPTNIYAFVKGSDGQLWLRWFNGAGREWFNQSTPQGTALASSAGAFARWLPNGTAPA